MCNSWLSGPDTQTMGQEVQLVACSWMRQIHDQRTFKNWQCCVVLYWAVVVLDSLWHKVVPVQLGNASSGIFSVWSPPPNCYPKKPQQTKSISYSFIFSCSWLWARLKVFQTLQSAEICNIYWNQHFWKEFCISFLLSDVTPCDNCLVWVSFDLFSIKQLRFIAPDTPFYVFILWCDWSFYKQSFCSYFQGIFLHPIFKENAGNGPIWKP